jgi:hypothetical protein
MNSLDDDVELKKKCHECGVSNPGRREARATGKTTSIQVNGATGQDEEESKGCCLPEQGTHCKAGSMRQVSDQWLSRR